MPEFRIVLTGEPYKEPRYYGELEWDARNVYVRHPGGGKDSRHSNGATYLTSTGSDRALEFRVPTSAVGRELINFIALKPTVSEPPVLRGGIKTTDLVIPTTSAGTAPRLAVELVANSRLTGVLKAWESNSTVSSVRTFVDKGLDQTLVVALAGARTSVPSTGGAV
jgi:hypothetical protein